MPSCIETPIYIQEAIRQVRSDGTDVGNDDIGHLSR
jgi:hypothetical protein